MTELAGAVRQLLLYTLWADRLCLKTVEQEVRPDDLMREAGTSFGSLFGTLAHILGAQRRWLVRAQSKVFEGMPGDADFPDWESLSAGWLETAAELGSFLASLSAEQVHLEMSWTSSAGKPLKSPLWQALLHLVNHSTYHRGQVASLMRQMGYRPPATDLIDFLIGQSPG